MKIIVTFEFESGFCFISKEFFSSLILFLVLLMATFGTALLKFGSSVLFPLQVENMLA